MKHNNVNLSLLSDSNIDGNVLNIKIRVLVFFISEIYKAQTNPGGNYIFR